MAAVLTKKRMSKMAMRVAIAKDVIAQVRRKKLTPITGNYVARETCGLFEIGEDLQSQVANINCRVCAKGAMFIAHVRRFDNHDAAGFYDDNDVCEPLLEYFQQDQLDLIEQFYERWALDEDGYPYSGFRKGDEQLAFERKYRSRTARLIGIMRNIVRNKGVFKP